MKKEIMEITTFICDDSNNDNGEVVINFTFRGKDGEKTRNEWLETSVENLYKILKPALETDY